LRRILARVTRPRPTGADLEHERSHFLDGHSAKMKG
jgi:hypothetical protein